jgi:hypothetical protein
MSFSHGTIAHDAGTIGSLLPVVNVSGGDCFHPRSRAIVTFSPAGNWRIFEVNGKSLTI